MTYDTVVGGLVETAQRDALGHVIRMRSDGAGRTRQQIDALGKVATSVFDANGNRITTTDANGVGMTCIFDARNRDVSCTTTRADVATTTTRAYDADNNVISETDALGKVTTHAYDARNRKVQTTDRIAATTTFRYDAVGNLTRIIDAEGNELVPGNGVTDYAYDSRNLLIGEAFPTGSQGRTVRTYTYDGGRRLTSRTVTTDPASGFSETTTYAYDNANRLITRGYADAKNDTFTYDAASRLKTVVTARYDITVARTYDAAGRLTSESQTAPGGRIAGGTVNAVTATVRYQHDDANRTTQITYPFGQVVTRAYTDRNQLASVGYDGAMVATRAYDDGGRLTTTTYGNGVVESRTYIPGDQRVKTIAAPGVTGFTYTYDANGRKLTETDGIIAANSQTFAYDSQDRLTAWSKAAGVTPAQTQTWNLTPVGDWASTVKDGLTQSRTHNRVHEVTAIAGVALSYDAKGNLTQDEQGQRYTWDPENRLATATVPPTATTLGTVASYAYDALGRRLSKTVNGRVTRFWHDGAQVVQESEQAAVPSQAEFNGAEADGTTASAALSPANGGVLTGSGVTRINFQPEATVVPAGFLADKGKTYGVRTNGKTYGWTTSQTSRQQVRNYQTLPELDTAARLKPTSSDTAGVWEIALPNGTYPVIVVCGDPLSTQQTNNLVIEGITVTDPDPSSSPGYAQGDFDGYAVTATVNDGKLTITTGSGAVDPKLCFIEIGPVNGAIDAAAQGRLADLVAKATDATYAPQQAFGSRGYVYASYVDEPLMMVTGSGSKHYFHQNHLYSIAAMTDTAGAVVERYRYDAYGKRAVTAPPGTPTTPSAIGQQRGFTGYYQDAETGQYYARARMYSSGMGRFLSRDPWTRRGIHPSARDGYQDGWSLYSAYFAPNMVDPFGTTPGKREETCKIPTACAGTCTLITLHRTSTTPSVLPNGTAQLTTVVDAIVLSAVPGGNNPCRSPCSCGLILSGGAYNSPASWTARCYAQNPPPNSMTFWPNGATQQANLGLGGIPMPVGPPVPGPPAPGWPEPTVSPSPSSPSTNIPPSSSSAP